MTPDESWRSATEAGHLGPEARSFLTEDEIRHYNRFLGGGYVLVHPESASATNATVTWTATVIRQDASREERDRLMRELAGYRHAIEPAVLREGYGPDACSTSQVLAVSPEICWDVCGYYRRLGVHWKATRRQLLDAYMNLGVHLDGPGNAAIAYALSQLLNRDLRREYDLIPLGHLFLKDRDTAEMIKKKAIFESAARAAETGSDVTPEDVLAEWGLSVDPAHGPAAGEQTPAQAPASLPRARGWLGSWTWYRLSGDIDMSWRSFWLERWQLLLVREFAARKLVTAFAVGLYSGERFYVKHDSSTGSLIIFLGKGEPSEQLAREAVDRARLVLKS